LPKKPASTRRPGRRDFGPATFKGGNVMARTKQRVRRTRSQREVQTVVQRGIEEIRTRRYLAFVRAIVGAARSRNAAR
jgi:hypothetical protein